MKNKKLTNSETKILFKLKELENRIGRLIPEEMLNKEIDSSISIGESRKTITKLLLKGKLYHPREGYIMLVKEPTITPDLIEADMCDCLIRHLGMGPQHSRIFCDKIEYRHEKNPESFNHHLMLYSHLNLVFKVWLPNGSKDKEFRDIFEAMKSCGIKCLVRKDGD